MVEGPGRARADRIAAGYRRDRVCHRPAPRPGFHERTEAQARRRAGIDGGAGAADRSQRAQLRHGPTAWPPRVSASGTRLLHVGRQELWPRGRRSTKATWWTGQDGSASRTSSASSARSITLAEEEAIAEALPSDLRPAFALSLHTGLRWSEQAGFRWRDATCWPASSPWGSRRTATHGACRSTPSSGPSSSTWPAGGNGRTRLNTKGEARRRVASRTIRRHPPRQTP